MSEPQRLLGRYEMYAEIAAGGMATIHLGRLIGPAGFTRTIAIKKLHPQFAKDPAFSAMFLDEARLAARIQHPHVVQTLDVAAENGELFAILELVDGEPLSRLARRWPSGLPISIAVAIIAGVCEGLHAAHEARGVNGEPLGIVHRDVSPQNVLVGRDGLARVLDFGVAKAASRLHITEHGQIKGKLAYMAPEQLRAKDVDRRADVYSTGVVLWELLTGKRLFTGHDLIARALDPNIARPREHRSDVPAALESVTMKALEPERENRFATAHEMAKALEAAAAPATTRAVSAWVTLTAGASLDRMAAKIAAIAEASLNTASVAQAVSNEQEPTPRPKSRFRLLALVAMAGAAGGAAWFASRAPDRAVLVAVGVPIEGPHVPTAEPKKETPATEPMQSAHTSRAQVRPVDRCKPPYVIGSDGVKRFKVGCLR